MTVSLQRDHCYSDRHGQVRWEGQRIVDADECQCYLAQRVYPRLTDEVNRAQVEADLRDLATTDMETSLIEELLNSPAAIQPWQVGESVAECLLEDLYGIKWPWNMERDKRTPRASLPGADLVGFLVERDDVYLVVGEVKTSEDDDTPPGVMNGRSGMIYQLEQLVDNREIHGSLIKWLAARCRGTQFEPLYKKAVKRYLRSGGRELRLFGFLMRDTTPNPTDVSARAAALSQKVAAPTLVGLHVWYLPHSVDSWPLLAGCAA